jgi:hypothetical protein
MTNLMENLECHKDEHSGNFQTCRAVKDVETSYQVRWCQPIASDHLYLSDLRGRQATYSTFDHLRRRIIKELMEHLGTQFPEGSYKHFDILNPANVDLENVRRERMGFWRLGTLASDFI